MNILPFNNSLSLWTSGIQMAKLFSTFSSTFTRPAPSIFKPSVPSYEEEVPPLGSSDNKGEGKTLLMGMLKPMSRIGDLHDIAQMTWKETDLVSGRTVWTMQPGLSVSDGPVIFETKSSAMPIKVSPRLRNCSGCHILHHCVQILARPIQIGVVIQSTNGSREKPLNGRNVRDGQRPTACKT